MNRDEGTKTASESESMLPTMSRDSMMGSNKGPLLPTRAPHGHSHGGHGHAHQKQVAGPDTSMPSNEELMQMPSCGVGSGCKALIRYASRDFVGFFSLVAAFGLLFYSLYLSGVAMVFHFYQDCWFGLVMRVLIGRNAVILVDCVWVHVMLYKIVYCFKIGSGARMGRDKLALYRIRNRSSVPARLAQVFIVFAPMFYFMFDREQGCTLLCCPSEAIPTPVPDSYVSQSILAIVLAVPFVLYALQHSLDPVEEAWIKANRSG